VSTRAWGTTATERELDYPCDRYVSDPDATWYRGTDVAAPAAVVFRWICQLRAAPYSYDLLDNFARRSPRTLTPGLDQLAVGQRVMHVFELVDFDHNRQLTAQVSRFGSVFGDTAVTYAVVPAGDQSRLLVKVVFHYPLPSFTHRALKSVFPAADTVMMRRQLRNLKQLAERDAAV
jgi:hypothetical protein